MSAATCDTALCTPDGSGSIGSSKGPISSDSLRCLFFAKSSHFVPVTQSKSTQARLRRVQVGVLWEKTAWNLNISDLERLLLGFFFFSSPSLVQILHICHKDGGALMHLWQGGHHRSQCGVISENPESSESNLFSHLLANPARFPVGNGWQGEQKVAVKHSKEGVRNRAA